MLEARFEQIAAAKASFFTLKGIYPKVSTQVMAFIKADKAEKAKLLPTIRQQVETWLNSFGSLLDTDKAILSKNNEQITKIAAQLGIKATKVKDYGEPAKIRVLTYIDECGTFHTQLEILDWGDSDPLQRNNSWTLKYGARIDRYNFSNGDYNLVSSQDSKFTSSEEQRAWLAVQNLYVAQNGNFNSFNGLRGRNQDGSSIPNVSILGNNGAYYVTMVAETTPISRVVYMPLVTDINFLNNRLTAQGVVNFNQNFRSTIVEMQNCGLSYAVCDIAIPSVNDNGQRLNAAAQNLLALSFQQTITNLFNSLNIALPNFNISINQAGFGVQLY